MGRCGIGARDGTPARKSADRRRGGSPVLGVCCECRASLPPPAALRTGAPAPEAARHPLPPRYAMQPNRSSSCTQRSPLPCRKSPATCRRGLQFHHRSSRRSFAARASRGVENRTSRPAALAARRARIVAGETRKLETQPGLPALVGRLLKVPGAYAKGMFIIVCQRQCNPPRARFGKRYVAAGWRRCPLLSAECEVVIRDICALSRRSAQQAARWAARAIPRVSVTR